MSIFDDLNNENLGDDLEISLGDKSIKLGDLRNEYRETRTRASQYDSVAAERDAIRTERDTMSRSVADLLAKAGQMADADPGAPPDTRQALRDALAPLFDKDDPSAALFEDKVFGGALTKAEQRAYDRAKADIDKNNSELAELRSMMRDGFQALTNAQVAERDNRWYEINKREIPKGEDKRPMSLTQIREYAVARNLMVPNTRLVDYDAALESLTEPTRREQAMSEAEKRGYEKGLQAARSNAGKVLPIFGDRSAGAPGSKALSTVGKTQKQIMQDALRTGLAEITAEEG